jgi:hypothetical protein
MSGQESEPSDRSAPELWAVWRIDDTGNSFLVRDRLALTEAERLVAQFTARGHKQTYWAERDTPTGQGAEPDGGV